MERIPVESVSHGPGLSPATPGRVLVVEDDREYARLVQHSLEWGNPRFRVDREERLDAALSRLEREPYDAMVVDLGLPDGNGKFTLGSACSIANHMPVVVLTGQDDDRLALTAIEAGAQDYLVKQRTEASALSGAVRRAIARYERTGRLRRATQRHAARGADPTAAPWDVVTGLPGEILFLDRLAQALARAERRVHPVAVVLAAFDDLDMVRSCLGDGAAEVALRAGARRLGARVRRCDTLARLSERTFGIIVEECWSEQAIESLAHHALDALTGTQVSEPTGISLCGFSTSVGVSVFPEDAGDTDTLVENAEAACAEAALRGGGCWLPYSRRSPA